MPCHSRFSSHQRCPDTSSYLADQIYCLKQEILLLQQQVADLNRRDNFIWCKLKELAGENILDRVEDLETLTEVLTNCGVLTLDCVNSDSGSASFSV